MDHKTFGRIVATLRKEQINYSNGRNWSQQDLADDSGLTPRVIGRIERGNQARLDGGLLQSLANSFELTSLERREFFAMATEVMDSEIVRKDLCNEDVFEQVWDMLNDLCAPAFLMDPFGDIVGANRSLIAFHDLSVARLQEIGVGFGSVNNLALLLEADTPMRQVLGHGWRSIALANVQQWRVTTLRYRHTPRFKDVRLALSACPDFRMLWAVDSSGERAIDDCSKLRSCKYKHGVHGPVAYTVFTNTSLSTYGELYLCTFVPQNSTTSKLFLELAHKDNRAISFGQWPSSSLMSY